VKSAKSAFALPQWNVILKLSNFDIEMPGLTSGFLLRYANWHNSLYLREKVYIKAAGAFFAVKKSKL
jgi:hypothetical protein